MFSHIRGVLEPDNSDQLAMCKVVIWLFWGCVWSLHLKMYGKFSKESLVLMVLARGRLMLI
nr:MAG TPA: hypothetical protein [Caudoviricetes sp.]